MERQKYQQGCRDFIREIEQMSNSYHISDKFRDAVRMMALSMHSPTVVMNRKEHQRYEEEFSNLREKYGEDGYNHVVKAFALLVENAEECRTEMLGHCLEMVESTNKNAGQFLTPLSLSRMMAQCTIDSIVEEYNEELKNGRRKIIKINDPACGAGVLLVETAEELMKHGVSQGDIIIYAEDLDFNAFNMAYVNFSLLGYPAIVTRKDSLSLTVFEGSWYTIGYFLHSMPMRMFKTRADTKETAEEKTVEENMKTETVEEKKRQGTVQMQLF